MSALQPVRSRPDSIASMSLSRLASRFTIQHQEELESYARNYLPEIKAPEHV
jgi:hypothetical protein